MKTDEPGYVYILTNPSFREDWVKIGKSSRAVNIRSKELDNTAVPLPFEIYATLKTTKYSEAEKLVHNYIQRFTNLRIRDNREFFNVKPEEALEIFRDVAMILDDAEIDEVYKHVASGAAEIDKSDTPSRKSYRDEKRVWMLPSNCKYFDIHGCVAKYNEIYWSQYNNIQKGDTGYLYCSAPDSALRYKFEVVENDQPYKPEMEREKEFQVDPKDWDEMKAHNRFFLVKILDQSSSSRVSLANLLDHGLKLAPRGAINLSYPDYKELLEYIEKNF